MSTKTPWNFFVPETFGDAVSYEQQIKYLHERLRKIEEEGTPTPDLTELKQRVTTLEQEVAGLQEDIEGLDIESIEATFTQINSDIDDLQEIQSQHSATLQGYNTRLLNLETTTDAQEQVIDALDDRVTGLNTAVVNIANEQTTMQEELAGKQDTLTAGANITIDGNVISATGGSTVDIDTTVTPTSQHAVTSEGIYDAIQSAKTAVETQHTTDINRIDGELATKAPTSTVQALNTSLTAEIGRVETEYKDADDDLDARLDTAETNISNAQSDISTLQQDMSTVKQTQTQHGTSISGLRDRMDTAETNITNLQTTTTTLTGNVSALNQNVQGKQDKLTAGQNITIQNNVISAAGGETVVLDDTVTESSSNGVKSSGIYTAIQNAKSELSTRLTDAEGDISDLQTSTSALESDVEQAQTDISSLQTGQQTLTSNLSTEAATRESADSALRVSINANTSDINTLRTNTEASIEDLETGLNGKQDTLTAGDNISIINNVISALTGGGSGGVKTPTSPAAYNQERQNSYEGLSCAAIMNLIRVQGTNPFMINTGKFVVPKFSGTDSEFVQVNTQTVWVSSLPAEIQEQAVLSASFGDPTYTEIFANYMYGMWNEWVGVNLSSITDGLNNMPTQDLSYSDDSLDITTIPLYPKCPTAFNVNMSQTYPPKFLKGYCVWIKESNYSAECFPLGIMLVELKDIPAHTHSEFSANTPLTANYKCLKWISVNSTYTGTGFGQVKATSFLITPIY